MTLWGQSAMKRPVFPSGTRRAPNAWIGDFLVWSGNFLISLSQSLNTTLTCTWACIFMVSNFAALYIWKALQFFPAWHNPVHPLNITIFVELSLIFLVTKNFFLPVSQSTLGPSQGILFTLNSCAHACFIHSSKIKWCQALWATRGSHRTCIPAGAQSWVKFTSFIGLGGCWRQELSLLSALGLAPKGTQES